VCVCVCVCVVLICSLILIVCACEEACFCGGVDVGVEGERVPSGGGEGGGGRRGRREEVPGVEELWDCVCVCG
jgi:hypothetical protein